MLGESPQSVHGSLYNDEGQGAELFRRQNLLDTETHRPLPHCLGYSALPTGPHPHRVPSCLCFWAWEVQKAEVITFQTTQNQHTDAETRGELTSAWWGRNLALAPLGQSAPW